MHPALWDHSSLSAADQPWSRRRLHYPAATSPAQQSHQDHDIRTATSGQIKHSSCRMLPLIAEGRECPGRSTRINSIYEYTNKASIQKCFVKTFLNTLELVVAEHCGLEAAFLQYYLIISVTSPNRREKTFSKTT